MKISLIERVRLFLGDPYFKLARRFFFMLPLAAQQRLLAYLNSDGTDHNHLSALQRLKALGFAPKTIIDCGANAGAWTRMCKQFFPDARVLMVEPQTSQRDALEKVKAEFAPTVDYAPCLAGEANRNQVTFYEMGTGSSVREELSDVPRTTVSYPMRTLDDIAGERGIHEAQFIKMDLEGYEIEALKGAAGLLPKAEAVMLEVRFIQYNRGAPIFDEVAAFMKDRGFALFDLFNFQRWKDNRLFTADAIFVKINSPLRKIKFSFFD